MFMYMLFIFVVCLILILMILLNYNFSMNKFFNPSKLMPFECGFNYISNPNSPFSLSFYLINLMFLVFDVEIIMLLPMIYNLNSFNSLIYIFTVFSFLFMLIITLIYEISNMMLEWII